MRRAGCVALALFGGTLACAEWVGPSLGRPGLAIVPLVSVPVLGGGTVLVDDLDSLRVVVHLAVQGRTTGVVIDTSVGVDEAGNAALTVPVLVVGSAQTFAVALQGIRPFRASARATVQFSTWGTIR